MNNTTLVVAAAVLTYLSRAAAVALLPPPRGELMRIVERLPAPLFASLAVFALVGDDVTWPGAPTVCAALAAVAVAPRRSLPLALAAGLGAFSIASLVW